MKAAATVAGLLLALGGLAASQTACSSDKTSTPVVPEGGDAGKGLPPASSADLVPDDGSPGAKAINTRRCGACHNDPGQPAMSGKSTMLPNYPAGIELYGPNLTSDMELGVGKWTDGQLRLAIREGVDDESLSLCPQMQHYKTMSDAEVDNIIKYLRSLPPAHRVAPRSICPPLKTK